MRHRAGPAARRWVAAVVVASFAPGGWGLQAQVVRGVLVDSAGRPVAEMVLRLVVLPDTVIGEGTTDGVGRFEVMLTRGGLAHLVVDRSPAPPALSDRLSLRPGDTVAVRAVVPETAVPLAPLVVTASRRPWWEHLEPPGLWEFHERRARGQDSGIGRFLTREDLRDWGAHPVALAIAARVPSMRAEPHPTRPGAHVLRGRGGCAPDLYVDGTRMRGGSSGGGGEPVLADVVSILDVVGVEVYRGPAELPGELRSALDPSGCGAVVVWTARGPSGGGAWS